MEGLINELVSAARTRIQTQAEFSPELAAEVADEVIEEFMADGLINKDEDIEVLKVELISRLNNSNEVSD